MTDNGTLWIVFDCISIRMEFQTGFPWIHQVEYYIATPKMLEYPEYLNNPTISVLSSLLGNFWMPSDLWLVVKVHQFPHWILLTHLNSEWDLQSSWGIYWDLIWLLDYLWVIRNSQWLCHVNCTFSAILLFYCTLVGVVNHKWWVLWWLL